MKFKTQSNLSVLLFSAAIALSSCSTSDGGNEGAVSVNDVGGSDVGGFQLSSISIPESFTWKINRPVSLVFTQAIDFSSISLNSIAIRDTNNFPANGFFSFDPAQPRVVTFQPTCPIESDFSDAGFLPGGKMYNIVVIGKDSASGTSVRSASGEELEVSQTRLFFTPSSTDLTSLFEDSTPGAPQPIIREEGSTSLNASFIEIARDSTVVNRIYFEREMGSQNISQPGTGATSIPTGHPLFSLADGMPLNLYSDQNSKIAFVIEVNQPVNPGPSNINSNRVRLEASATPGGSVFTAIPSTVSLVRNCTTTGATLRVEPIGVLPQNVDIRVVIDASFEDLIGDNNSAPIENFGLIRTRNAGDDLADELLEEFAVSGAAEGSNEDDEVAFSVPRAIWGEEGTLKPRFDFAGTGGPTGAFDFIVRAADGEVVLDTNFQPILDANQTLSQTVIKGRMDVRNFIVEQGATLQLRGSDQMIINATGDVQIDGTIDLVGFNAKEVTGVFTATFPEPGASGNLGGGKGGDASANKTMSTPRGDHGFGAFGAPNGGGRGGESGFGTTLPTDNTKKIQDAHPKHRRGGGGGGGAFAPNEDYSGVTLVNGKAGSVAQTGATGDNQMGSNSTGAISGLLVPAGGSNGPTAFIDGDDDNDFFGVRFDPTTGTLINGELTGLHAGSGGGGGGDSVRAKFFPNPKFSNATEDKGAAGGGGSGGLLIRALGDVRFGSVGRILAEGGAGDRGQLIQFKQNFFFRSGASGGGGSGGHVIIETGGVIDLGISMADVISARGGKGGPGNATQAQGSTNAKGGNGGPGVVQLHPASGLVTDILVNGVPATAEVDLETLVIPRPNILLPNFGAVSKARSDWIPLGGAVGAMPDDVTFRFDGTDGAGLVEQVGGVVQDLTSIIGPKNLAPANGGVLVDDNTFSFDFTNVPGATFAMANEIYRDNPVLMKNFLLVFTEDVAMSTTARRYNIASATLDPNDPDRMVIKTTSTGLAFSEFVGSPGSEFPSLASVTFEIVPRFFRITTNEIEDRLPTTASIRILFEGVDSDEFGMPNDMELDDMDMPVPLLVPQTADVADLFDSGLSKPVEFFRFEVEFNIDAMTDGLKASSPRPVVEFLRMPFEF